MVPKPLDVRACVSLDILRGQMELLLDPPEKRNPTYTYKPLTSLIELPPSHETQPSSSSSSSSSNQKTVVTKLQHELDTQLQEEDKWTDLTTKLETKAKQMDDKLVRLTTSVKVFEAELSNRNDRVDAMTRQLHDKEQRAQAQLQALQKEHDRHLEQAAHALTTSQQAESDLQDAEYDLEVVEQRLTKAQKDLVKLQNRIADLEINLQGNHSLSGNQREYMKAECAVEKSHRDDCQALVDKLVQKQAQLIKMCHTLRGKAGLFRDERQRRLGRAKAAETKRDEQEAFHEEELAKWRQNVETAQADRDAWKEKTQKLADDVEPTRQESAKLQVKVQLFRQQLETVKTTIQRLQGKIAEYQQDLTNENVSMERRDDPASTENDKVVKESTKEEVKPYVWQPPGKPQQESRMQPKKAICPPYRPATTMVSPPTTIKVNHVQVHTPPPQQHPATTAIKSSSSSFDDASNSKGGQEGKLSAKLEELQRNLEQQKRVQQEQARNMEQQLLRLADKVDVLAGASAHANTNISTGSGGSSSMTPYQLHNLKTEIQKDAMRDDYDMRQLLQQMNQQFHHLSSKLEGLGKDLKQRDEQYVKLEQRLQQKENQHFEQMRSLRGEMERQLFNQQQVIADKMNETVLQMQNLIMADRGGSHRSGNDSIASLESLHPWESPRRTTQVRFVETPADPDSGVNAPNLYAPSTTGNGGLSMTSGIMMKSPLFQNMAAAVGKRH